jgi:hypothetical protein
MGSKMSMLIPLPPELGNIVPIPEIGASVALV